MAFSRPKRFTQVHFKVEKEPPTQLKGKIETNEVLRPAQCTSAKRIGFCALLSGVLVQRSRWDIIHLAPAANGPILLSPLHTASSSRRVENYPLARHVRTVHTVHTQPHLDPHFTVLYGSRQVETVDKLTSSVRALSRRRRRFFEPPVLNSLKALMGIVAEAGLVLHSRGVLG